MNRLRYVLFEKNQSNMDFDKCSDINSLYSLTYLLQIIPNLCDNNQQIVKSKTVIEVVITNELNI